MNEIESYLEKTDQKIIRLWNACRSAAVIADTLDIDIEYVQAVIDEPSNYAQLTRNYRRENEPTTSNLKRVAGPGSRAERA